MLYDSIAYETKFTVVKLKVMVFNAVKRRGRWGESRHLEEILDKTL